MPSASVRFSFAPLGPHPASLPFALGYGRKSAQIYALFPNKPR